MAKLHLRRTPLKWGNHHGIRLTRADFQQLGTTPDKALDVDISPAPKGVDLSKLHMIKGRRSASVEHTRLSAEL